MAGASTNDYKNAQYYLDPNQQDLLLAALASNQNAKPNNMYSNGAMNNPAAANSGLQYASIDSIDPTFFASPQQVTPDAFGANLNFDNVDDSPFIDYLDGDNSLDFDNGDNSDLMIGGIPGDSSSHSNEGDNENSDKRKSPDDDGDDIEGGGKRREGEDKTAKKPGRKPLTSEPTTKRKAQNRAAQRAFRERKEKHLKDLETKVGELEKASDATNHENGMLRAQVQRLQTELREYRKRLSLNSTGLGRAPAVTSGFASLNTGYGTSTNNFQFDFPKFGGLPGSHILDNGPLAKAKKPSTTTPARSNSSGASLSPKTQLNGTSSNSPSVNPTGSLTGHPNGLPNSNASSSTDINGLFSPMVNGVNSSSVFDYNTNTAGQSSRRSTDSSATQSRVFQFNSGSSTSDSPSASSVSQDGMGSSCDTSPEPSHNSPITALDTIKEGGCGAVNPEGEVTFCDKLNMACGNLRNPIPRALSQSNGTPAAAAATQSPAPDFGLDFLANQNGGQFDPTLFGDYRESQAAIVGDGDFTGGFFNDAFPLADFGSPFNIGDNNTPAIQKSNPLEEIERIQDGLDDEVVPGEDPSQLLNCHKIWDKLSKTADFNDGKIDIDNLCSELRAKARCSESGVVVDHKDVEAALKRIPEGQRVCPGK